MKKIAFTFMFIAILIALQAQTSTETKLKEAKDLYEKQLITQSEYESLKKKALGLDDAPQPKSANSLTNSNVQEVDGFRTYLEKKITDESKGLIKLISFTKTDGVSKVLDGQNCYDMYFTIEIQPIRQIFKSGNEVTMWTSMNGLWSNFELESSKPDENSLAGFASLASGGVKTYNGNIALQLKGNSNSCRTENHWIINSIRFTEEKSLGIDKLAEKKRIEKDKVSNTYVPIDKLDTAEMGAQFESALFSNSTPSTRVKVSDVQKTYDNKDVVNTNLQKLVGRWSYKNEGVGFFEGIKLSGVFEFDANMSYGKFTTTIESVGDLPKFKKLLSNIGKSETNYFNIFYNDKAQTFIIEQRPNSANANMSGKAKYYLKFQDEKLVGKSLFLDTDYEFGIVEVNKQ